MINKALFSSNNCEWETPLEFFEELNVEFHFNLDPCALPENAKCTDFFTPEVDGLKQTWKGRRVFVNPPYGKEIKKWVEKCYNESREKDTLVVLLIPARTDTAYFHDYILNIAKEIRFIRGRLRFGDSKFPAPFPSMVVVF